MRRPGRGCRYRGVVKGPFGADEHELLIERLEDCREVSIFCEGTGVTTRFVLTDAQGGTFVEGYFAIEPNSIGITVVAAVAGRRIMRSWLEQSLANLKHGAERARRLAVAPRREAHQRRSARRWVERQLGRLVVRDPARHDAHLVDLVRRARPSGPAGAPARPRVRSTSSEWPGSGPQSTSRPRTSQNASKRSLTGWLASTSRGAEWVARSMPSSRSSTHASRSRRRSSAAARS